MSKYIVETFYTCSFKIVHKLDELNEKNLSELENRSDGEVKVIDVKLNNRKTKTTNKDRNSEDPLNDLNEKNVPGISSIIKEKVISPDTVESSKKVDNTNINKFHGKKK